MYPPCRSLRTTITSIRKVNTHRGNYSISTRRVTKLNIGGTYTELMHVYVTRTLMTVRDPLLLKHVGAERTMYGQTGV